MLDVLFPQVSRALVSGIGEAAFFAYAELRREISRNTDLQTWGAQPAPGPALRLFGLAVRILDLGFSNLAVRI